MLLSLLKIPSVSAGPPNATGIGPSSNPMPINITNRCGVDGAMDHEFMVTLKPPPPSSNGRRTQDLLNYLQGWAHQYDAEDTSNGTTLRKLEANSHSLQVLHFYTATHLGIAVSASDEVRGTPTRAPTFTAAPPRHVCTSRPQVLASDHRGHRQRSGCLVD